MLVHSGAASARARNATEYAKRRARRIPFLISLMPEVTFAREHHRQSSLLGGRDDIRVAHRAPRLNHPAPAGVSQDLQTVAKGEERAPGPHPARRRPLPPHTL